MQSTDRVRNNSSDPTVVKLLEVDSLLATQVAELQGQLESVQQKRKSLESVITMFNGVVAPAAVVNTVQEALSQVDESAQSSSRADSAPMEPASSPKPSKGKKSTSTATQSQKSPSSKAATNSKEKTTRAGKGAKKDQNWQRYVREEFGKTSLPEAVSTVLQEKPKEVFGIPDILDAIFLDEMPKEARNKASNRISNILSTGLKSNKWYRGRTGHYSVSSNSAMADLAS